MLLYIWKIRYLTAFKIGDKCSNIFQLQLIWKKVLIFLSSVTSWNYFFELMLFHMLSCKIILKCRDVVRAKKIPFLFQITILAFQLQVTFEKKRILLLIRNNTDLGSLIGNIQCGNFRIFLPLRFYVNSILVILKPQKLPIWPFEEP